MIKKSLKTRQICFFFIAFMPVVKFFMMPSVMANSAGRDEWLSCIINVLLDFATLAALVFAFRNVKTNFFSLSENALGKVGSKIVYALYAVYFLMKAYVPIAEQRDYVELTLYSTLPNVLDFMPFMLLAFYFAQKKLRVIGRVSDVVWVLSASAYLLMFSLAVSNAEFDLLLPVGKTPFNKIAQGSFYALNWFGDAAYFIFFVGEYEHKKGDGAKIVISYLVAALSVLVFVVIFYGTFSSIAFRQRYALTEMSKYSSVINNVGRFDYLAIFFLLLASAFSAAVPLYFASKLAVKIVGNNSPKIKTAVSATVFILYTAALLLFKEYNASIEKFMKEYGGYAFLLFGNVLPVVFAFTFSKGATKNAIPAH